MIKINLSGKIRISVRLFFFIAQFLIFSNLAGQVMPVPAEIQGELIPKILLFNRSFTQLKVINFGIIYNKDSRISFQTMIDIKKELEKNPESYNVNVFQIEISELDNLHNICLENNLQSIYISPLRGVNLKRIQTVCSDLKILSFSAEPEFISNYFSVGFNLVNNKVKIYINQESASKEGAIFGSKLLKLAVLFGN